MNAAFFSHLSSFTSTFLARTTQFVAYRSLPHTFSFPIKSHHSRLASFRSQFVLTTVVTRCYSTRKFRKTGSGSGSGSSKLHKVDAAETTMDQEQNERDAFYVVRKGDVVGIYNTLTHSQAQVGSSVILLVFPVLKILFLLVMKLNLSRKMLFENVDCGYG